MKHAREDYNRIQDPDALIPADEPVFLIRGQDIVGAEVVRYWANCAANKGASSQIMKLAREHAAKMDAWPKKKVADLPND